MKDPELKHLEFIQSVINRMANNSLIIKGWSITLISGLFALSFLSDVSVLALLPILPVIMFWGLDAYYLRQEKLFRDLYDQSRKAYIQNDKSYDLLNMIPETKNDEIKSGFCLIFSSPLLLFHGIISVLVIIGIVLFYLTKT